MIWHIEQQYPDGSWRFYSVIKSGSAGEAATELKCWVVQCGFALSNYRLTKPIHRSKMKPYDDDCEDDFDEGSE